MSSERRSIVAETRAVGKLVAYRPTHFIPALLALVAGLAIMVRALVPEAAMARAGESVLGEGVYAIIDGEQISETDFEAYFHHYVRQKVYHAPSDDRLPELRAEALEALVTQRLALHEGRRRGIEPDGQDIDDRIAAFEREYGDSPDWEILKARIPEIRLRLAEQDIVRQLRTAIMHVAEPADGTVEGFYRDNPDLFTEPAATHLSVILIAVDPAATNAEWRQGREQADQVHAQLVAGTEFGVLARDRSNHESADRDGDIGYVHEGQIPPHAQGLIDKAEPGQFTVPVQVLEGYAIFRVEDRRTARLMAFDAVRDRARALYMRDRSDDQWTRFIKRLRDSSEVVLQVPSEQ